jgi:hypothetical protein
MPFNLGFAVDTDRDGVTNIKGWPGVIGLLE